MVDRKDLEALVAQQREKREPSAEVLRVDETHLKINGHAYELVTDVRHGFDFAEFAQRYSTILSKYDYIVGDWGFEQLRLKGFYAADRAGAKQNQIDAVQDYLYESCNFGCAYFILHNLEVKPAPKPRRNRSRRHNNGNHPTGAQATKTDQAATTKSTGNGHSRRHRSRHSRRHSSNTPRNHNFTEERRKTPAAPKPAKTVTVASGGQGRRHFTIRQKKEE
ncbi:YutD family protein [Levilactobacillus zymae]|nr:YutD family protein [Levilactobacillus zymae]MDT6980914.1 YutD family protein [Levilactobacillus zymae]